MHYGRGAFRRRVRARPVKMASRTRGSRLLGESAGQDGHAVGLSGRCPRRRPALVARAAGEGGARVGGTAADGLRTRGTSGPSLRSQPRSPAGAAPSLRRFRHEFAGHAPDDRRLLGFGDRPAALGMKAAIASAPSLPMPS